jgi:hypothetical protein
MGWPRIALAALLGGSLLWAAPAQASSPRRRSASGGDEVKPSAAARAAMKQVSAEKLDQYVSYWKTVAERSEQASEGEAAKPLNKQRDLLRVYRSIRAEVRAKSGLTSSEIHSLDLAVETYFKYLKAGALKPVCATDMSPEKKAALDGLGRAQNEARVKSFAQDFGDEPAKLLGEHERALRDARDARDNYGN